MRDPLPRAASVATPAERGRALLPRNSISVLRVLSRTTCQKKYARFLSSSERLRARCVIPYTHKNFARTSTCTQNGFCINTHYEHSSSQDTQDREGSCGSCRKCSRCRLTLGRPSSSTPRFLNGSALPRVRNGCSSSSRAGYQVCSRKRERALSRS